MPRPRQEPFFTVEPRPGATPASRAAPAASGSSTAPTRSVHGARPAAAPVDVIARESPPWRSGALWLALTGLAIAGSALYLIYAAIVGPIAPQAPALARPPPEPPAPEAILAPPAPAPPPPAAPMPAAMPPAATASPPVIRPPVDNPPRYRAPPNPPIHLHPTAPAPPIPRTDLSTPADRPPIDASDLPPPDTPIVRPPDR